MSQRHAPDPTLIQRLRTGDTRALAELMAEYAEPLLAYVAAMVGSDDAAQDVIQDVFLRLWAKRTTLREDLPIVPYLFRAARNAALDARRGERRAQHRAEVAASLGVGLPSDAVPVDAQMELDELSRVAARLVATLPDRCREVFLLVRRGGVTYQDVAAILGISVSTVKTQMARAVATLSRSVLPAALIAMARTIATRVA